MSLNSVSWRRWGCCQWEPACVSVSGVAHGRYISLALQAQLRLGISRQVEEWLTHKCCSVFPDLFRLCPQHPPTHQSHVQLDVSGVACMCKYNGLCREPGPYEPQGRAHLHLSAPRSGAWRTASRPTPRLWNATRCSLRVCSLGPVLDSVVSKPTEGLNNPW